MILFKDAVTEIGYKSNLEWERLFREAVDAPIPRTVQGQVGLDFKQLELIGGVPPHSRGLDYRIFMVSCNSNHSEIPKFPY